MDPVSATTLPQIRFSIRSTDDGFLLEGGGEAPLHAPDDGRLLFELERALTIALQSARRDLYFLHAAALSTPAGAVLFVGDSGAGKSTLSWALLRHGFGYLSDELAPVSPSELTVEPYPRAICLKGMPPEPYGPSNDAVATSRGFHVPVRPHGASPGSAREIRAIFFLEARDPANPPAVVRPIGRAEAVARLVANVLNPLCHPSVGLEAALAIARHAPCFALRPGDLGSSCREVEATLAGIASGDPRRASAHGG